jgi:hypothetical protein
MNSQVKLAQNRLFDADALAASNFKLFPGSSRETSAEQFAEQVNKAISQIEAGDFDLMDLDDEDCA